MTCHRAGTGAMSEEQAGAGPGLMQALRQLGGAIGVAVGVAVAVAVAGE